ncbi:MAG: rarD [Microbacteriaceae bacterium]|nr:rarD [Microbacteriaceae bacterium]
MPSPVHDPAGRSRHTLGIVFGFAAFVLWGFLPGYFLLLKPASPFEIVAWRIIFSIVFCLLILTVTRAWPAFIAIVRQPRLLLMMALAACLIYINWQVFVFAALSGHVIETALGYFINPIVTVSLGVLFLGEKLRRLQWIAVGTSVIAVLVLAINYGSFPWISLSLAFSFGLYGLVKKSVGPKVDAVSGLTLETAWLVPVAVIQLVVVAATGGLTIGTEGVAHTLELVAAGVITMTPLLLFAAASRRLPLVHMGLIQYIAPVLQFVFGAFVLHEALTAVRWFGFGLVWLALAILSIDLLVTGRASRRASPLQA